MTVTEGKKNDPCNYIICQLQLHLASMWLALGTCVNIKYKGIVTQRCSSEFMCGRLLLSLPDVSKKKKKVLNTCHPAPVWGWNNRATLVQCLAAGAAFFVFVIRCLPLRHQNTHSKSDWILSTLETALCCSTLTKAVGVIKPLCLVDRLVFKKKNLTLI